MARTNRKYNVYDAAAPRAIASSTNASPIEVTTAAPHNYSTGQKVAIVGHTVNTAANGFWEIVVTGATTFELVGSTGNGVGGATGTHYIKPKMIAAADATDVQLQIDSDGGGDAVMVFKVVGSQADNPPDFAQPQGPDNQWGYLQIINLNDSVEVNGSTGITLAASDINGMYEVNTNGVKWVTVLIESGTEGELTVLSRIYGDE